MDQAIVDDFKQFVAATVTQATTALGSELRLELRQDITKLSDRVDTMDLKLDTILNAVGEQFEDHERRITRLEAKPI